MRTVGIKELKAKLSRYVKEAGQGEEVVVTDRGKEVALLVPVSRERRSVTSLSETGRARWAGGKPEGMRGIRIKGKPLSKSILEDRR